MRSSNVGHFASDCKDGKVHVLHSAAIPWTASQIRIADKESNMLDMYVLILDNVAAR